MYDRALILSAMEFRIAEAYWISPGGKMLPVGTVHINEVIDSPESFGLTEKEIKDTYAKHKEKFRSEGKAREEIMKGLFQKGWIRIRYYNRNDSYTVNVNELTKRAKEYLFEWALKTIENLPNHRYSDVLLDLPEGSNRYSLDDLTREVLLSKKEQQKPTSDYLVPVTSVMDILNPHVSARAEKQLQELLQRVGNLDGIYGKGSV